MQKKWFKRALSSLLVSSSVFSMSLEAAPYELIDLGTLGGIENYAFSLNELNEVTGTSDSIVVPDDEVTEENPTVTCTIPSGGLVNRKYCNHAYLYSNGEIADLGDFGQFYSYGFAINDNSSVVGYSIEEIDDGDDTTSNIASDRAFISFAGGAIEPIRYPVDSENLPDGVPSSQRALDITNDRIIVGYSRVRLVNDAGEESSQDRPYIYDYDNDSYTIIPVFSNELLRSGSARAINNLGQVAGWAISENENNTVHALLWDPASPDLSVDLGTLGGYTSDARDINDNGIIVGVSETSILYATNQTLGFLYDPAAATPMMAIPEFSEEEDFKTSSAYAINNSNQVVGTALISVGFTPRSTAFLYNYNEDTLINLNDMVDCSLNWDLVLARDINEAGAITGSGIIDGEVHSFLLRPTADTTPTNCTELRKAEDDADDAAVRAAADSGSFGLFTLFLMSIFAARRYRK